MAKGEAVMRGRFDQVGLLVSSGQWERDEHGVRQLAKRLAEDRPVRVVILGGSDASNASETPHHSNVTLIRYQGVSRADHRCRLHRYFRNLRVVRPLLIAFDTRFSEFVVECFSPLKVWCLSESDITKAVAGDDAPHFLRAVVQADVLAAPEAVIAKCKRDLSFTGVGLVSARREGDIDALLNAIETTEPHRPSDGPRLNVLVLYDAYYRYIGTVREYLEAFLHYSKHRFFFANATAASRAPFDMSVFDVVFVHYSVRMCLPQHISPDFAEAVQNFGGLKMLCIQDEYDCVHMTHEWMERLGYHVVFTCVPQPWVEKVYPAKRLPGIRFISVLTGYVSEDAQRLGPGKPLAERRIAIGYRGRSLSYFYGKLGREKLIIGQRMKEICQARGVACDIEWTEQKRIYGRAWYDFLGSCRATLASESGSNVFDWDGSIRENITRAVDKNPALEFDEAHALYIGAREGEVQMNQVSPRIFESIAMRTALILFEGAYSGVVKPDEHFIPLKKDFSNVDDVLRKLADDSFVQAMTDRAYRDVIASGKYTYRKYVELIDATIASEMTHGRGYYLSSALVGAERDGQLMPVNTQWDGVHAVPTESVSALKEVRHLPPDKPKGGKLRLALRQVVPAPVRKVVKPPLKKAYHASRRVARRVMGKPPDPPK